MRFFWHPIGLEDFLRTYGGSEQQAESLIEGNLRLQSMLYLQCHMICYTQNGRWPIKSWTLSSLCPPCSIAINPLLSLKLSTIHGHFHAVTTFTKSHKPSARDLDLLQTSIQSVAWHINLPPKWSVSHLETQEWSSVLHGTRYPDTTKVEICTTVLWCLGAIRQQRDGQYCQYLCFWYQRWHLFICDWLILSHTMWSSTGMSFTST